MAVVIVFGLFMGFILIIALILLVGREKQLKIKRIENQSLARDYINGTKQATPTEINVLIDDLISLGKSIVRENEEDQVLIGKLRELRNHQNLTETPGHQTPASSESQHTNKFVNIILVLSVVLALACVIALLIESCPKSNTQVVYQSSELQNQAWSRVQKLIDRGVFYKVEKQISIPYVWVTPSFMALDYDTKAVFVSAVYSYYYDGSNKFAMVWLFDNDGKRIGLYSKDTGLEFK